jgi:holo-[acyl-carrier protein] synthase
VSTIVGHGIDLVSIERIAQLMQTHGEHFLNRVYTTKEQEYCLSVRSSSARLAGRFAAKEAVAKCFGTGMRDGMRWVDIATLPDKLGKPEVVLTNRAAEIAAERGIAQILISITHTDTDAMASAIGVGKLRAP